MCAISGIVNLHSDSDTLATVEKMTRAQCHRGPDDSGTFCDEKVILGHSRLAIIDLETGHQPIVTPDGALVLAVNGEIYNFREVRADLEKRGHHFQTASDSECIIHLYEEYGEDFVNFLDGMFAFALYDTVRHRVILGRDRLGQKPLLYFMNGDTLIFASEFAGLMTHPDFPEQLDTDAISDYLSLQYIPSPDTAFRNVRKLPPGHLLCFNLDTGTLSIRCYWQLDYSIKNSELSIGDAAQELRKLVEKAVEKRLVSDVPLGTFLSGGVDSCIITGITAKKLYPAPCEAFTAGFGNAAYDERSAAQRSAEIINSVCGGNLRCHEKMIKSDDFDLVLKLLPNFGEPFADASALPFFLLSEFAKSKISVALSGDGADEIFAGYERYLAMRYAEKVYWLPGAVRQMLFGGAAKLLPDKGERTTSGRLRRLFKLFASPEKSGYFNLLDRCPATLKKELFGPAMEKSLKHDSAECFTTLNWELISNDKVEKLGELDLKTYLPGDILVKADVASMANALELRSPFMDTAVVEFAARLPMKYKLHGKERKKILKMAFPEFITPELSGRPKRGFGVPVAAWLRESWKAPAQEKLFTSQLISGKFVNESVLKRLWDMHQSGEADYSYILWELIVLDLFLERLADRKN